MPAFACVFESKSYLFIGKTDILQQATKAELLDRKLPRTSQENPKVNVCISMLGQSIALHSTAEKRQITD